MKKLGSAILLLLLFLSSSFAQTSQDKPKLVVVMVVDQMRADYISRYWDYFGEGGLKRLVNKGYSNKNTNYNFFPTYTAAGHASISTGSIPSLNGIVGNDWYDRNQQKSVYCTSDNSVSTIGSNSQAGKMSPSSLLTTTVGDELRLATNFRSKVIGVALKDRAAILTAGHNATGVYWFDETTGGFISSSYYTNALPGWLTSFNNQKLSDKYLSEIWKTSLPIEKYQSTSTKDDVVYEGKFKGEASPTFPHNIPSIRKSYNYGLIRSLPNGNKLTFDLARAAIEGEKLGKNTVPDLLNVSFSSPDYIGHQFGPRSIEVADMYIKFDQDLSDFLSYLDTKVGKDNYVICLTADHGAAENPVFLEDNKLPGGYANGGIVDSLNSHLKTVYGIEPITAFKNLQLYLDHKIIQKKNISYSDVVSEIKRTLLTQESINSVYSKEEILVSGNENSPLSLLRNGFYYQRCGDITIVMNSGWLGSSGSKTGTTHGSTNLYDTHVPLIWYGKNISAGKDYSETKVSDIAITLSGILDIQSPSGSVGKFIPGILK
ncbi:MULTISPECIES: alkaline phosphatase PafA [Olivibacter]|uniref:Alkaline phosphatase PafA n=1 Tax=Olivibacter jilunii TaxID=985016 RepID=A0ABW6B792_9SPHI